MRRARSFILLAIVLFGGLVPSLAPAANAQADPAAVRVVVRLASSLSAELHVEVLAEVATSIMRPDGTVVALAEGERAEYDVPIERPSTSFVLVAASDIIPAGADRIVLVAPTDWAGVRGDGALVFARGMRVGTADNAQVRARVASVGEPSESDRALLGPGLAYLAAQHPAGPREVLLVRAPDEVAPVPTLIGETLVVPTGTSDEDTAAALVRLYQGYRVVEVAPTSASWFRDGEERMQAPMLLMAAGLRSAADLEETFSRARAVGDPDVRLTQATAGSTLSRNKGLVVVRALDAELRNATRGTHGLADLLASLDGSTTSRLDSAQIETAARQLGGQRIGTFFERYVYGTEWPSMPSVRDAADVFVTTLSVSPARAPTGAPLAAIYSVVNRGTQSSELDLLLSIDGTPAATQLVDLGVGASANGTISFPARGAGDHVVKLGARSVQIHVLSPARISLARTSMTPEMPRAGEPFTLLVYLQNDGEVPGKARVAVYEGERLLQRTTPAVIEGNATNALTLPMRLDQAGLHALDIRLKVEDVDDMLGEPAELTHTVDVQLSGEARDTPFLGVLALLAVLGCAAFVGSRVRR